MAKRDNNRALRRPAPPAPRTESLWPAWTAFLLPAAITAALVAAFAVDVPYHDQFELIPHLDRLYSGGLRWADFDKQHNEHRILVPQTLFILLAWLTRFDARAELIPNFLATLLTGFLIFRIWIRTPPPVRLPWYFLLPCSALLFGWRQYESLLWGACLVNTLTVLGVVATVYFLWRSETGTGYYALALATAFGASFSQGSGLLAWPLGLGILALTDLPFITKVRRMTGWCFIGFLVMVVYFANYRPQVNLANRHPARVEPPVGGGAIRLHLPRLAAGGNSGAGAPDRPDSGASACRHLLVWAARRPVPPVRAAGAGDSGVCRGHGADGAQREARSGRRASL